MRQRAPDRAAEERAVAAGKGGVRSRVEGTDGADYRAGVGIPSPYGTAGPPPRWIMVKDMVLGDAKFNERQPKLKEKRK